MIDNVFLYKVSRDRIMIESPSKQLLWQEAQAAAEKHVSEVGMGLSSAFCDWNEDELIFTYRLVPLPNVPVSHGSDIPEVPPTPNTHPAVWAIVIEDAEELLSASEIKTLLLEDMKKRDEFGLKKYKTRLHPYDGRDTSWDMYQELLDLIVYMRKKIYEAEQEGKKLIWDGVYRQLLCLALDMREKIYEEEMEKSIEGVK